jgi:LuxR family maltose regulon positive regulatory protein
VVNNQFFHGTIPENSDNQVYLERPRIDALLERMVRSPLVSVTAGAGYGKTQAVYSFLQKHKVLSTWMRLSELDNNEWRFWENFSQAVELISPEGAAMLREMNFPATERQFNRYIAVPRQTVDPGGRYIFVYDDFHLLRNRAVLDFMERSVTSPFPSITSVLISRREPAINTIKLFSKGLLANLTEEDLRFSPEEMRAYFELLGVRLTEEAASGLYRDTEGWAFAIHLAGLSLKSGGDTEHGRRSMRQDIFSMIDGEIFSAASAGLQKYLIKLSLIEHLSLELLADLAGDSGLLEEMKGIGSYIRFDSYSNTYQIHPLFLEYLTGKQGELSGEEKRDVYIRSARWCASHLLKMDAIGYYEKAGAYDELIAVVDTLPIVLPDRFIDFLLDILDRAPRELYDASAAAPILHARLLLTRGRMSEAAGEAQAIITRLEALPPSPFRDLALCGAYLILGFNGIFTSVFTGDFGFPVFFEKAHGYYPPNADKLQGTAAVANLSSYACRVGGPEKGGPERYIQAIDAAEPHIMATMNGAAGLADIARTEFAYYRGDLEDTEKFAYRALYKAQKWRQYEIENRALFYLLRVNLPRGNYPKIDEIFQLLEAQLQVEDFTNRYIFLDMIKGWFYSQIGLSGRLESWLKKDLEEAEVNSVNFGLETQMQARCFMAENNYAAALSCMESQNTPYGLEAYLFGRLTLNILRGVCYFQGGEPERAFQTLEAAYALAAPNALDMPFIEMGDPMRLLCAAALKAEAAGTRPGAIPPEWLEMIRLNASAYGKKLLVAAEYYREPERTDRAPGLFLTRREMAVLTGLSRGLTRGEIAREGDFSLNTVKSLIAGLYGKLGAVNRADAVRIAAASGLIKAREG